MKRLFLLLLIAAGAGVVQAGPASAHQNGCHRWHSCPSDTGSYVCGDTGYSNYCGGSSYTPPTTRYSYTPPTTRYSYTPPTTAYRYTTPTTSYRYTTPTTAYSYTPRTIASAAEEESEASSTGDAVVGFLALAGGVGYGAMRLLRKKKNQQ